MKEKLIRTLNPEVRVIDAAAGLVDYVASDETLDSYREVIRASGWRFDLFRKNAPFVDSHQYHSIDKLLGQVVDFRVAGGKLIERVKWAIDVPDNELARIGFAMTEKGYLKAVSVGFFPVRLLRAGSQADRGAWLQQLQDLGYDESNAPRAIYLEQQQIELSACVIGANPNALARAFKDGAVSDQQLETLSAAFERQQATAPRTLGLDHAGTATRDRERQEFMREFKQLINRN